AIDIFASTASTLIGPDQRKSKMRVNLFTTDRDKPFNRASFCALNLEGKQQCVFDRHLSLASQFWS
ncbi:MAG: hypothetical protein ACI89J_001946, partial [Hyphomicrobiaceae bacterium]